MEASIRDLRYKTKEILTAIDNNMDIIITNRGKKIARIIPYKKSGDVSGDTAFGMWKDRKDMNNVTAWLDNVRNVR